MEQATEKQIGYAKKLGIENPEQYSKTALKELISAKLGNTGQTQGQTQGQQQNFAQSKPMANNSAFQQAIKHDIVLAKVEKPHSYEFGKAGNRHKVYYSDIEDLKKHIKDLQEAGLYDELANVEVEKY